MKKIMLIGNSGSGKTTLYQKLVSDRIRYDKTQAIEFHKDVIDTPGEYLENRNYYSALMVTSMESDMVGLVMDCKSYNNAFPPGFARMFTKPIIGIVTKMDLIQDEKDSEFAERTLQQAGASNIFKISALENKRMDELIELLDE